MLYDVCLQAGNTCVFDGITFTPRAGKISIVLGKSGVGKTTLIRLLAGLDVFGTVEAGSIKKPSAVAWMGQTDLLFPWQSVLGNALLPISMVRTVHDADKKKAIDLLYKVGLGDKIHAYVNTLSGGQRQRVALVRTVMHDCDVVVMDEPFSALDEITKKQCEELFCSLLAGKTIIMVRHDIADAVMMGDDIYMMCGNPVVIRHIANMEDVGLKTYDNPKVRTIIKNIWEILGND